MSEWRDSWIPFGLLLVGVMAGVGTGVGVAWFVAERTKKSLGFKLNNPGNIERGQAWDGLAPTQLHTRYATFVAPEFGIRVIAYLLRKYAVQYGLNTVRKLISHYAPAHENPTDAYISLVSRRLGVLPDQEIDVVARIPQIVRAIVMEEIGYGTQPYPESVIDEGIAMARDTARTARFLALPSSLPSASFQFA